MIMGVVLHGRNPLYCAQVPEKEYYYMLFQHANIIFIIMIYLKLFKKKLCMNPFPPSEDKWHNLRII